MKTLFKNGTIYDGSGGRPHVGDLLIEDDRILAVGGEITEAAERGELDLRVNLGDFLGANLLLGRGPLLRFHVGLMTSPDVKLVSQLSSTGINQTRHALVVKAAVDIDLFIPWGSVSSRVETDILVAETLIVGRVPDTYMNWEEAHGTSGSKRED